MRIGGMMVWAAICAAPAFAQTPWPTYWPVSADFTSGLLGKRPRLGADARPAVYPEQSRRDLERGETRITHCVTAEGLPTNVQLATSSGFKRLDDAALAWVKAAPYQPGDTDGTPIDVCGVASVFDWGLLPGAPPKALLPFVKAATPRP